MALINLSEVQKLGFNDLSTGIAEEIIYLNPIMGLLPWNTFHGNAYAYTLEGALGNVISGGRGMSTAGAKSAPTFVAKSALPISIIGDIELSPFDMAMGVGANAGMSPEALQVASKAKAISLEFQRQLFIGSSASPTANVTGVTNDGEFDGIVTKLLTDSQFAGQKTNKENAALTLEMLDELVDMVQSGQAQFIVTSKAGLRKIKALKRAAATGTDIIQISGVQVDTWSGVPILVSDFIATDAVGGTAGNQTHLIAGCFDDGSRRLGLSGILSTDLAPTVEDVGPAPNADVYQKRVKFYGGAVVHATKSIAGLFNVTV